jgi:hypothetical protein
MARRSVRTRAGTSLGDPVRLSLLLHAEVHLRLKALALVRRTTAQALVSDWVEQQTAGVRLPSVGGVGSTDSPGDAA